MKLQAILPLAVVLSAVAAARAADDGSDAKKEAAVGRLSASTFSGLALRSIGPALMSGRIGDFAVHPRRPQEYFAAVCSGGVWKTTNAGTTWTPVFDGEGSYSIGCLTLDPGNPSVVWVGTGENNSQRSVSFGDGVYKSVDGGKSWKNVGLRASEHIGMITIDPTDTDTVFVAAQGPLWRSGGDRGLYRTRDGGETWERVLDISDDTGVNEVHMDPRDPEVLYASTYQRRRRVWTLINGGPESDVYKSTDGGDTWRTVRGLPGGDKGRIGLDISPVDPDVLYAIVEAAEDNSGFYRSTDRGETWQKRSGHRTTSPQYYNEIVADPHDVNRVYALDTILHVSEDGGATFSAVPRRNRHVDDHALWIDPRDADHLLVGSDGGVYESYDRGANWDYKANLPITQFYRVAVDNAEPFYNVYGGTQDNNTQGGPSRTTGSGIINADWFVTVGGDGFEPQVDPTDPNIVYSQWQYGGLVRHDRRSGQNVSIKPEEKPGEDALRWNWDSPLLISPHDHERLYFAANKLYRSDDRGNSWTLVSGELTRALDRNELEVMGRIQPVEAVAKHRSTSQYGNCVALSESPLVEGLIYVGTDDGLVQVTEDGGETWRKIEAFPHVPDMTYVSFLAASQHEPDRVYATFDNHKSGDFAPYILRSDDRGGTWKSIASDLGDRDIVWSIAEDHVKPELLFVGTEFGLWFTIDGGDHWVQLGSGLPTIAVRDIAIQPRESDLVLATFGRGFYILDDYSPLRLVDDAFLKQEAAIFPIKDALRYIQTDRQRGAGGRGSQGAAHYEADNPPYGAVFTYHLRDKLKTRREKRRDAERKGSKDYPTIDELRIEDREETPSVYLTVRNDAGDVVRRIEGSRSEGIHRTAWDLRYPATTPVSRSGGGSGALALPGTYTVGLSKLVDGEETVLVEPVSFEVVPLDIGTFEVEDREAVLAFRRQAARLQRAVAGALRAAGEAGERLSYIRRAIVETPDLDMELLAEVSALEARLDAINVSLRGDPTLGRHSLPSPPSINDRVQSIVGGLRNVTSAPTGTQRDAYRYAADAFGEVLDDLRELIADDLALIEGRLEDAEAPWTPGRVPVWEE